MVRIGYRDTVSNRRRGAGGRSGDIHERGGFVGWDCFETTGRPVDAARQCIGGDVVAIVDRGATVYAAVRRGDVVGAVVAVVDHVATPGRGRRSYRVKVLDEREGPFYWDAPAAFLAGLTTPANAHAAEWRRRCALKAAGGNPAAEVTARYRRD